MSYRDLDVYKDAHRLGVDVHHFSLRLPAFELYETGSQVRRSSKSISANIVEGFGRRGYKAEFLKHLTYAQASCDETIEWLTYIKDCYPDLATDAIEYIKEYDIPGKRITRFIEAVERGHLSDSASEIQYPASSIPDPAPSAIQYPAPAVSKEESHE